MGSYYNNVKLKPDPNQQSPFKVYYLLPKMDPEFYIKPTFLFPKFGWVLWEELNIMSSCTPTKYSGNQFVEALLFSPFHSFFTGPWILCDDITRVVQAFAHTCIYITFFFLVMELNEDRRNFIQRGPVIPAGQILNEKVL